MMIQILWFLNKCIKAKLVTSCVLGLALVITPAVLAEYKPPSAQKPPSDYTPATLVKYEPPADQKPPSDYTRGGTAGSRDGCEGEGIPVTALAPLSHVGQTASTRPTFAWFVPDSTTKPVEFRLYEYDSNGKPQLMGEPISSESFARDCEIDPAKG